MLSTSSLKVSIVTLGAGFAKIAVILALYDTTSRMQYSQYQPVSNLIDQPLGNFGKDITSNIPYVYRMLLIISPNRYSPDLESGKQIITLAYLYEVCFE